MSNNTVLKQTIQSPYLTIAEFAAYTKGTVRWAYSLTSQRQVPFIKAQGRILFHRDAVDAWLLSKNVPMLSEIQRNQYLSLINLNQSHEAA